MTDYFALLDQPRRPWLDLDELKQTFHAKALRLHPDAQRHPARWSGVTDGGFSELNEAYQVLQDPKRRIHHLLTLEGRVSADRHTSVPREVERLFSSVAGATQQADTWVQKSEAATTPLSRSLLKPQMLKLQKTIGETLQQLSELHDVSVEELQRLSTSDVLAEDDWAALRDLYLRFSYLTRWIAELEEKQDRLVTS